MREIGKKGGLAGFVVVIVAVATGVWFQATADHRDLERRASAMTRGDPDNGRLLARTKGCGGCHEIPGVAGAHGNVGPPLTKFASRMYVGGVLTNTPEHLQQWLLNPPLVDPKSAMPNVGLSDQEARDLAAYLYTLD